MDLEGAGDHIGHGALNFGVEFATSAPKSNI